MSRRGCDSKDFGGPANIIIFTAIIYLLPTLFFWILPSCALLRGVKRNQSCMFVPWILSMGFQSSLLAWVLVELSFRFSHREIIVGVTLLFTLTVMQIIVLKECLRIKRHKRQNKNRYVLPARRPQRPAQEADPAGGGPGGGAAQDACQVRVHLGSQYPAADLQN